MAADLSESEPSTMMIQQQQQYRKDLAVAGFVANQSLWIGDLRPWMNEDYFADFCNNVLEVDEFSVKVIRNIQNQEPEYAFIQFRSTRAADRFIYTFLGKLMPNSTKIFNLKWATFVCGLEEPVNLAVPHYMHEKFRGYGFPKPYHNLLNIVFVRVNKVKTLKSDRVNVYGTVRTGIPRFYSRKVYYRSQDNMETICAGHDLRLIGPPDPFDCDQEFTIDVMLKVDGYKIDDWIHWGPFDYDKKSYMANTLLEEDVGVDRIVTVGYSLVTDAYIATVEVLLKTGEVGESLGVYGTIKAVQHNRGSNACIVLFDKFESEQVQVYSNHAIPLTRSIVVMPCEGLTIIVELSDIAMGCKIVDREEVFFKALCGTQAQSIGEVQVSVSCI